MPLTDIPQLEKEFRHTQTLTQETRSMAKSIPFYPESSTCYFTDVNWGQYLYRPSFTLTPIDDIPPAVDRQLALIYLSQNLLKNSQPLEGKALAVMNKTSARLFSKTPTRL